MFRISFDQAPGIASVDLTHGQCGSFWIIAQRCEAAMGRRRKSRMSAERISMLKAQLLILYNPTCMHAWYIDWFDIFDIEHYMISFSICIRRCLHVNACTRVSIHSCLNPSATGHVRWDVDPRVHRSKAKGYSKSQGPWACQGHRYICMTMHSSWDLRAKQFQAETCGINPVYVSVCDPIEFRLKFWLRWQTSSTDLHDTILILVAVPCCSAWGLHLPQFE